ncbi:cell wall-associated NlpC family hydrolase [Nocardioides albertanoniae]|uniref:Cell wall-associated NlpC family hydrolase n=1 Tax=Nocardioides albertanoniae TaxID=1175486 RepID=A0A543AC91_9ACTN|nr:C40 family peptidase [Nocardioides albertanoniae]TQL70208.1 cell wall-associated NlpC family hydrolase [Nocardioides albertanoniae]
MTTTVHRPTFVVASPAADAEHETEVVPGEEVVVLETQGEWAHVVVPAHATAKDERGYPGWLPAEALTDSVSMLLSKARSFLGVPYVWGGTTGAGIDCSGLVLRAAEAVGVRLPRDAHDQAAALTAIDLDDVRSGDLYFFAKAAGGRVFHVAIATAAPAPDGSRPMIHADGETMGVIEESMPAGRVADLISAARL